MNIRNGRLIRKIKTALRHIYTPDGVELVAKTINGDHDSFASNKKFIKSPLSIFSSFLGLPNRQLNPTRDQSWENIRKNFIGWQKNKSKARNILNATLMVPLNVMSLPFKLTLNLAKFLAIGLPSIVAVCFKELSLASNHLITPFNEISRKPNIAIKIGLMIANIGLGLISVVSYMAYLPVTIAAFYTSLIFSPIKRISNAQDSMPSAIDSLNNWLDHVLDIKLSDATKKRLVVASKIFITALMSILVISTYGTLFSFALNGLMAAGPYLATHLPAILVNAFNSVVAAMTPIIAPAIEIIAPIALSVIDVLSFGMVGLLNLFIPLVFMLGSIPALMVTSLALGAALATVGSALSFGIEKFRNFWHSTNVKPVDIKLNLNSASKTLAVSSTKTSMATLSANNAGKPFRVKFMKAAANDSVKADVITAQSTAATGELPAAKVPKLATVPTDNTTTACTLKSVPAPAIVAVAAKMTTAAITARTAGTVASPAVSPIRSASTSNSTEAIELSFLSFEDGPINRSSSLLASFESSQTDESTDRSTDRSTDSSDNAPSAMVQSIASQHGFVKVTR
jgi:hypothetical protein